MGKIATLDRMREIYNTDQIEFWIDELSQHGVNSDVIDDIRHSDATIACKIVRDLITDSDLPPQFSALAALLDGYDEADATNFGGNGCKDYIDRAMEETTDTEARLVEGEACITDSGCYVAWSPYVPLCKGGVMVVNLKDSNQ